MLLPETFNRIILLLLLGIITILFTRRILRPDLASSSQKTFTLDLGWERVFYMCRLVQRIFQRYKIITTALKLWFFLSVLTFFESGESVVLPVSFTENQVTESRPRAFMLSVPTPLHV